jgi:hypothetical protein
MSADVVDIRQLAPQQNLSVELGALCSEQDGRQITHATYVIVSIGDQSISLKPDDARKVAEMLVEYAAQCDGGASS